MRLRDVFTRRKPRPSTRPMLTDWTTSWTARDWADLPPHHPHREDDSSR